MSRRTAVWSLIALLGTVVLSAGYCIWLEFAR